MDSGEPILSQGENATPSTEQMILAMLQQLTQSNGTTQQTLQHLLQGSTAFNTQKAKERLPQLSEFDGTRGKFLCWEMEARNKLATDGAAIGDSKDQLHYVFARLRSNAGKMCLAFTKAEEQRSDGSGLRLLDYLSSTYGNPHRQQVALDNLRTLSQGPRESFAQFLPKFETELADAGALAFADPVKISYLRGALNRNMKEKLVGVIPTPSEYGPYVTLLQQLGSQMDILQLEENAKRSRQPSQHVKEDVMDWEPTPVRNSRYGLGLRRKEHAKWVSPEEIRRRWENRSCLRCGKEGHIVKDCPLLPPTRPSSMKNNKTTTRQFTRKANQEEEEEGEMGGEEEDKHLSTMQGKE